MAGGERPGVVYFAGVQLVVAPPEPGAATDCSKQPQEVDSHPRALWLESALLGSGARGLPGAGAGSPAHSTPGELPLRVTLWTRWAVREPRTLSASRRVPAPRSPESWGGAATALRVG